ncbi:MAG: hypothetical protein JWP44_1479 [Mucilaginibacter sp.]|nr:hypothetical protein [Mucilaginibacter sp.]
MNITIQQLNEVIDDVLKTNPKSINWDYKLAVERWSKKEIIGHLIDSAQINLQRFVRCTYEENFKLVYDQVKWVATNRYQEADIDELLSLWRILNRQIIRVLTSYPADRLLARCDTSKTTLELHTVEWLAQDYVQHLKHHLKQIY